MKQPYVVAVIEKDAVEHLPVVVPAHEVAVLAAVHGAQRVRIDEDADLPTGLIDVEFDEDTVHDEFTRLEQRYGVHPDTKQSYAQMVFGGPDGLLALLERSDGEDIAPRRATASSKRRRAAASTEG